MADIYHSTITSSSISVYLENLDTDYEQGIRTVYWGYKVPTATGYTEFAHHGLAAKAERSDPVICDNLAAGTTYAFLARVVEYSTNKVLATIGPTLFTTDTEDEDTPDITSAELQITGLTKSRVTLRLRGMDKSYEGSQRIINYYLQKDSEPTITNKDELYPDDDDIPHGIENYNPNISSIVNYINEDLVRQYGRTQETIITSLEPNTTYHVLCILTDNPPTYCFEDRISFTTLGSDGVSSDYYDERVYSFGEVTGIENAVHNRWLTHIGTLCRWDISFLRDGKVYFKCSAEDGARFYLSNLDEYDRIGESPLTYLKMQSIDKSKESYTVIEYDVKKNTKYYIYYLCDKDNVTPSLWITQNFAWSSAVTQGRPFIGLLADEWNYFLDKIIQVAKDTNGGAGLAERLESQYVVPGQELKASSFNIVRSIIDGLSVLSDTGIEDKKPGDPVLANNFIVLASRLNFRKNYWDL